MLHVRIIKALKKGRVKDIGRIVAFQLCVEDLFCDVVLVFWVEVEVVICQVCQNANHVVQIRKCDLERTSELEQEKE